jgi:hypothetical protein
MPEMNDAQKTVTGALLIGSSLLTANAALIAVAGGIGVNWASEGLQGLLRHRQAGKLAAPLVRAHNAAIRAAVEQLRSDYLTSHDSRSSTLAFDLVAACANNLASAAAAFADTSLAGGEAQAQLERGLDDLLYGHDPRQVAFLKTHLLPTTARALRDALSADAEAWMSFHGWLIEDLRAGQTALTDKLDHTAEVLARFEDPSAALHALQASLNSIGETTGRIDARTERMEQTQDDMAVNVRMILAMLKKQAEAPRQSSGTSVNFDNRGMQVKGDVYQAGTININKINKAAGQGAAQPSHQRADHDKVAFRNWLVRHFSRADLELLCANVEGRLGKVGHSEPLNLEMIGGDVALPLQCQKLIEHLERRGYLDILFEEASAARPGAPFGEAG